MSPIENVITNLVTEATNGEARNKKDRSRDLFGVQLEVRRLKYILINIDTLTDF